MIVYRKKEAVMQKEATHRNWWRIESEINETSSDYFLFGMDKRTIFGYFKLYEIRPLVING